ncbi:MAG: hypothetical protein Q4G22_04225 [Paracoccus sp. (in: a-proteobacteria)]|uniref:hypothetical protein n=1 Tax=Paracoccus sp. TaxID=267 RepID=UPI0026DEA1C3|nr:hypothetical protein [Paracoccus sp. (in: a-proteobacteria)]MDO5631024.1 hypothetical protein [Paracoccus sp. (in: a-proteobacteria)]
MEKAKDRDGMSFEFVGPRDFDLPSFDEAASNLHTPPQDPKAVAWQKKISEFDSYLSVAAK